MRDGFLSKITGSDHNSVTRPVQCLVGFEIRPKHLLRENPTRANVE